MIKTLKIENFRSVEQQTIDLAPLTFLYGNNAAGKSSLFYSLNVLRNIVSNSNQAVDAFFNLGFANLGSFEQVVFKHDDARDIGITVGAKISNVDVEYGVQLSQKEGEFSLHLGAPYDLSLNLPVTFPYPINGNAKGFLVFEEVTYNVSWNGIVAQVTPATATEQTTQKAEEIVILLNSVAELIRSIDVVPLRRGFSRPQYGAVNVAQFPITEEEVASMLISDKYLDGKVSTYLEQTIDRQFRTKTTLGTSQAALTTIEKLLKNTSDIVNEGFGVNQLVYLLAKTLNKKAKTLCIEEPEINLHPGVVRRLPKTLLEIVKDEKKQLLISTHSEALIVALLSAVAGGEVSAEDIAFYLTKRPSGVTSFDKQKITEEGQVEGGLKSFMAGELEDIEAFLKPKRNKKQKKENNDDGENLSTAVGMTSPSIEIVDEPQKEQ